VRCLAGIRRRSPLERRQIQCIGSWMDRDKDGRPFTLDDLHQGCVTQAWLATSEDELARSTGGYFYHQRPRAPNPIAAERSCWPNAPSLAYASIDITRHKDSRDLPKRSAPLRFYYGAPARAGLATIPRYVHCATSCGDRQVLSVPAVRKMAHRALSGVHDCAIYQRCRADLRRRAGPLSQGGPSGGSVRRLGEDAGT
jgi:hypothetical protein